MFSRQNIYLELLKLRRFGEIIVYTSALTKPLIKFILKKAKIRNRSIEDNSVFVL